MSTPTESSNTRIETVSEVTGWLVAGGILTMALFPLALPFIILTVVALLPLALPVVAIGLIAAVVALPVLAVRTVGRRVAGARRRRDAGRHGGAEATPGWVGSPRTGIGR